MKALLGWVIQVRWPGVTDQIRFHSEAEALDYAHQILLHPGTDATVQIIHPEGRIIWLNQEISSV